MRAALVGLALTFAPLTMSAQTAPATDRPAVLVADQVFITRDKVLVAQGNVEAFQGETRLRATAIRYNQATGALSIEGPIVLSEGRIPRSSPMRPPRCGVAIRAAARRADDP